MLSQIIYWYQ